MGKAFHQSTYRRYELEEATVQSLQNHYKKHKGGALRNRVSNVSAKLERSSERIHADVAEMLQEVVEASIVQAFQVPNLGISVDIAVNRRKSSTSLPLATIDIDGPHCLVRSLDPTQTASKGFAADSVGVGHATRISGPMDLKRSLLLKNVLNWWSQAMKSGKR